MSSLAHPYLTEEQYLEIERKAEYKSEYIDGRTYAMAGVRPAHSELAIQLGIVIAPRVRPRGYRVFNSDMRIRTLKGIQAYPDLSVFCNQLETGAGGDSLLNPIFIGEVLSP